MSGDPHDELALKPSGLLFADHGIESEYRRWRNQQAIPRFQTISFISLLTWVFAVEAAVLVPGLEDLWPDNARLVVYGVLTPMFLWGMSLPYLYRLKHRMPGIRLLLPVGNQVLITLSLALIGVGNLGLFWANLLNPALHDYPMAMIPFMAFLMWIPFARIPSWQSLMVIAGLALPISIFLGLEWRAGSLISPLDAWGTILGIELGSLICGGVAFSMDRDQRRGYAQQLTVERHRKALEDSQKLIRRYVPAAVAEHIAEGRGTEVDSPQRRRVTVLFSDIVGFTDMADRLDAESMTQILNEYMAAMADIIEAHGGTLNEFIGDGIMAMFGAPNEMSPEDQALNAVKAAQEMQARLPELNNGWLKLGIGEPLQIRIGINTGVLSVGSFGSEGRMTYTAIGLQTNIAARIQSHCEAGGILLSDASWHLVKDAIDCEPKGEVECKGVHFPVKIYAPA